MTVFENAFRVVVGEEGGYTANPADPGNWTGRRVNVGTCKGTNFGISAAAYPALDIASLSLADAQTIYKRDYWDVVHGDELPPPLALLVFDAAVNSGVSRAARWLQSTLSVKVDGAIGPLTLAAAHQTSGRGAAVLAEYQTQRLLFLTSLPTWRTFATGWTRRVLTVQLLALQTVESA